MLELQPQRDPCEEFILVVCPYLYPSSQVLIDLDHVDEGVRLSEGGELVDHLFEVALDETKNALLVVGSVVIFEGSVLADRNDEIGERSSGLRVLQH